MSGSGVVDLEEGTGARAQAGGRTSVVSHLGKLDEAELSFLLRLLAWTPGAEGMSFPEKANPARLWEYIERHGLGGVVGAAVDDILGLPAALAEAAQARYWSNCLHGRHARERCLRIQQAAKSEGARVFFVKGPALVDQAYHGDDGMRGFSDLDIFAGNAHEARRLVNSCGARLVIDSRRLPPLSEIWDSGRIVAELDGWTLEIRYPIPGWTGPLFELFPGGKLPDLVETVNGVFAPPPHWHFLFLLHHLMMHHFFGRFVWFLDLAVLVRQQGETLDWREICADSERFGMREALAAVASFCRRYIDPAFPEAVAPSCTRWNRPFIRRLVEPSVIAASELNKQQASFTGRIWSVLHGAASYNLLADAPESGPAREGRGWQWTEARVRCVLINRWQSKSGALLARVIPVIVAIVLYPLARCLSWMSVYRRSK
jgi:hypothetical protein